MTKRERALRTVRFEETDRTPVYDIIQNDAVIEHFAGRPATPDSGLDVVGFAAGRVLDMTRMLSAPDAPRRRVREDGITVEQERWTVWISGRPFHNMATLVPWVEERIREANAARWGPAEAARERAFVEARWAATAKGDPTGRRDPVVIVRESGAGLTEVYWAVGMDLFTELMLERAELLDDWLEARVEAELRRVAAIANPTYIPIALTYDDIAYKNNLLFSPAWLREHWVPGLKRLVAAWHERDTYCLFHSDGNLWPILDDLIAVGIDGLNPLEVLAGMTVKAVRERYPQLFLTGGVDVSQLLTHGTPEEVRAACLENIAAADGRGYFLGSTTELHWDVPLANAIAMFDAVRF